MFSQNNSLDLSRARTAWTVFEPYHAMIYFAPEARTAYAAIGLKGYWMGYFASRSAPLGAASAPLVTATFFNFHPRMVARAIPDAWHFSSPERVLETRFKAADQALRRLLGPQSPIWCSGMQRRCFASFVEMVTLLLCWPKGLMAVKRMSPRLARAWYPGKSFNPIAGGAMKNGKQLPGVYNREDCWMRREDLLLPGERCGRRWRTAPTRWLYPPGSILGWSSILACSTLFARSAPV
jgi:hypothetical protein